MSLRVAQVNASRRLVTFNAFNYTLQESFKVVHFDNFASFMALNIISSTIIFAL